MNRHIEKETRVRRKQETTPNSQNADQTVLKIVVGPRKNTQVTRDPQSGRETFVSEPPVTQKVICRATADHSAVGIQSLEKCRQLHCGG
jgi:hypothetical protein